MGQAVFNPIFRISGGLNYYKEEDYYLPDLPETEEPNELLIVKRSKEYSFDRFYLLIGRGAILEAVFPFAIDIEGEEVKAFLIALSRLPGAAELAEKTQNARDEG